MRTSGAEQSTRARVARLILENGPVTAAALGTTLGLTPAAVRRHLDVLVDDGLVEARTRRVYGHRGRGRPARVFALTDAGRAPSTTPTTSSPRRAALPGRGAGPEAVDRVRPPPGRRPRAQYRPGGRGGTAGRAGPALAEALSADGYAASAPPGRGPPRASSCASTTARSRTSPPSSRSCARRRPRSSPAARHARPAPGHDRPRRRRLHHPRHRSRCRRSTCAARARRSSPQRDHQVGGMSA